MNPIKLAFVVEGLSAKMLRSSHQSLAPHFVALKVIERVSDVVFANISDYDLAVLWSPKDREKAESFVRNVRLRSPTIKTLIFCSKSDTFEFPTEALVTCHQLEREYEGDDVVTGIIENIIKTGLPKSDVGLGLESENTNIFLGMLLHELNNPISVLSGTLRLLERELKAQYFVAPLVVESVERLERTLWRMEKTVLSVRNLIGHNRNLEHESCSIKEIINFAVEAIEYCTFASKISIQRSGQENVTLVCKKSEICQILINLLTNAIDAVSTEDVKHIEIHAESNDTHVTLKIIDNGKGLDPETIQKIGLPNMTIKASGMGLGLMICKKLAEQNHGRFSYENKNGQTCFTLSLPKDPMLRRIVAS